MMADATIMHQPRFLCKFPVVGSFNSYKQQSLPLSLAFTLSKGSGGGFGR